MGNYILLFVVLLLIIAVAGCVQQPEVPRDEILYLKGHVYGEQGNPIEYAFVEASCKMDDLEWETFYYTDSLGYFELRVEEREGFCIINASIMGESENEIVFLDRPPDSIPITLKLKVIEVRNGTIEGYITSLSLTPVKGVVVEESVNGITALTDEKGYYRLENIKPGMITVVLSAFGYEMTIINSDIQAGENKQLNYSASKTGTDVGHINGNVTFNNIAVEGAEIVILAENEIKNTTTNGSGYYEFKNIPNGKGYRIMAYNNSLQPIAQIIRVSSGVTTKVDIDFKIPLSGAYVGGFIIDKEGNPIINALHNLKWSAGNDTIRVGSTGYYEHGDMVFSQWPITLTVDASAEGYRTKKETFQIWNGSYYVKHYDLLKEVAKAD